MLMTMFVEGLNAASLPLLPLLTCACAPRQSSSSTIARRSFCFTGFPFQATAGSGCFSCGYFQNALIELEQSPFSKARFLTFAWFTASKTTAKRFTKYFLKTRAETRPEDRVQSVCLLTGECRGESPIGSSRRNSIRWAGRRRKWESGPRAIRPSWHWRRAWGEKVSVPNGA